jgi:hypothetical protein
MNYLSMLKDLKSIKNISNTQVMETAKTTETLFVGFVAPDPLILEKISLIQNADQPKPLAIFDPPHDDDPLLVVLLELGEQICDHWNDSESARAEMKSDILSFPTHQRAALMATLKDSLRTDKPRVSLDGFTSATHNTKF